MPIALVICLALLQALVVTMWTVYALFLPGLLEQVGLPRSWVPWLVFIDQGLFIVADISMGLATDRISRLFGKLGPWLAGVALLCCLAFLAIPLVATGPERQTWLLAAVVLWVVCSSALRGPPLALLGKLSTPTSLPTLSAVVLGGLTLARVAVPYLNIQLQQLDPRWPFAITSAVLAVVVLVTVALEPRQKPVSLKKAAAAPRRHPFPVLLMALFFATGMEIHSFLQSRSLLAQFSNAAHVPWLSPTLWVACCLGLWLAPVFIRRRGCWDVLVDTALLGTAGLLLVAFAPALGWLLGGLTLTGFAWGAGLNALVSELLLTGQGREGLRLGMWSATLALAALLRVSLVLTGVAGQISVLLPVALWGGVALVLVFRSAPDN